MRILFLTFLLLLVALVLGFAYQEAKQAGSVASTTKTYTNSAYGFSFDFPSTYVLTESTHAGEFAVVLVKQEDAAPRENSEGPTSISMHIYPSADAKAIDWAERAPESNFELSNRTYTVASVGGIPAIVYKWSGLYEADNTVFLKEGYAYSIVVTYITSSDPARSDYRNILSSIKFFPGHI